MSEPISSTTAITLTIGSASMLTLFQHHGTVVLGALSGSIIYILSLDNINFFRKLGYFMVSFFSGIVGATPATDFISQMAQRLMEHPVQINKSLGAIVAASVTVRLIIRCIERVSKTPEERKKL